TLLVMHRPALTFIVLRSLHRVSFFFFTHTSATEIYTLSLHDALPISVFCFASASSNSFRARSGCPVPQYATARLFRVMSVRGSRSEEHTSELQSRRDLVCRLLLEKKKLQVAHDRHLVNGSGVHRCSPA